MYADFFQLSRRPFSATPDPNCCYLSSPGIAKVLSDVVGALEGRLGISIIGGEAGIGKSQLLQYLAKELQDRYQVAVIGSCQFPTVRSLLQAILFELGEPYQGRTDQELRLELIAALKGENCWEEGTVLFLDEAHLLSVRLLEEVRVLADLSQGGKPLLQIVMAGQPSLDERLTEPGCATFNQRIAVQETLPLLSRQETVEYIDCRTRQAGQPATELFTLEALLLIAQASDGLPRCINQLCDHALMLGYVEQVARVDVEIVRMALEDLQQLPLHWNPSAMSLGPLETLEKKHSDDEEDAEPLVEGSILDDESEMIDEDEAPGAAFEFGAEMETEASETLEVHNDSTPPAKSMFRIDREEVKPEVQPAPAKPEPPKMSAPKENPPAEERIFDRYAMLDAGRNPAAALPAVPPKVTEMRMPSQPTELRGPMSSAFFEHSAVTPPYGGEGVYNSDPLEFLDEVVMPLIEHAQQDELPTRSELDRRLNQFIAAQRAAVHRRPVGESLTDQEEEIGEEALDLCLELQAEMGNTIEVDPADLPDFSFEMEREAQEPLPGSMRISTEEAAGMELPEDLIARSEEGHAEPRAPKYRYVFSELRRRLRAESARKTEGRQRI